MRKVALIVTITTAIMLFVTAGIFVYLVFALLRPEKF